MRSTARALKRRRVSLCAALVAVSVGVATMVVLNPLSGSQAAGGEASAGPRLTATLTLFQAPRSGEDALSPSLESALLQASPNAEASESRRAFLAHGGTAVYLVPSGSEACLLAGDLSIVTCYPLDLIARGAPAASDSCSPAIGADSVEVGGIVPSDASDPVLVLSDGTTRPLGVAGNAYLEVLPKSGPLPAQISWRSPAGPVTVSADVPADAASEACVASPGEVEALVRAGKVPAPLGHPPSTPTMRVERGRE